MNSSSLWMEPFWNISLKFNLIMDYEKKYNELVERIKEFHEAGNALTKAQMEIILPELAESKDERIRKDIIRFFRDAARGNTMVVNSEAFTEWADYLENEEKQNSAEYIKRNSKEWHTLLSEQYNKGYWKGKEGAEDAEIQRARMRLAQLPTRGLV